MYTGPMKKEPKFPVVATPMGIGEPRFCSRAEFLAEKDTDRKFCAEAERCRKRRHAPGFEKIDDMRYGG